MRLQILVILSLFLCIHSVFSQETDVSDRSTFYVNFQKLYVHTDRDFYFHGDSIWFSAYLLDAKNHSPIKGDQNLHIDLIDSTGNKVNSALLPLRNGFAEGYIPVAGTTLKGSCIFRGYTNYLRNFGEEFFFHKTLIIDETKSSLELDIALGKKDMLENDLNVVFFAEGGILMEKTLNTVAVKITNSKGQGVNTNGVILNKKDKTVAQFETNYEGYGKFYFYPNSTDEYRASLNAFPKKRFRFIEVQESGLKFQLVESENDGIDVKIFSRSVKNIGLKCTLACMHRGEVLFYRPTNSSRNECLVKVDKSLLGEGINRFVLLNKELNPVSERLYFKKPTSTNSIGITLSKPVYSNRTLATLRLSKDYVSDTARVSLSVVNDNSFNAFSQPENIMSNLFLGSELLGSIKASPDYFVDDESLTSSEKLDLLMLTHGWSRYVWNKLRSVDYPELEFPVTAGINVEGHVKNLFGNKRVGNGEIILTVKNDSQFTLWETTNEMGEFCFEHIYVYDSAEVTLMARKLNQKENTRIVLKPGNYEGAEFNFYKFKSLFHSGEIPLGLYRQHYFKEMEEKAFDPDKNTILIKEVEVEGEKFNVREDVKFSQIYSKADYEIKVTEKDYGYTNIEELLLARAFVQFGSQPPVSLKAGGSMAYYVDGIPLIPGPGANVEKIIRSIPISSIERVDVLKRTNPTGMAVMGVRGVNGGVFIYTKRGIPDQERENYIKGLITTKIKGFSKYRQFYSPVYTPENINSEKPDYRTTLYWNPSIEMEKDEVEISFYTSDDMGRFKVMVEGITNSGKVCLGESEFEVIPKESSY